MPARCSRRESRRFGPISPREALPLLAAAVRAHPDDARLWHVKGLLHRTAEDIGAGDRGPVEPAAALAPADAFIAHSLACAAIEAGLPAVAAFELAAALAPGDERAAARPRREPSRRGRDRAAVALLEDRLGRDPGWLQGHLSLARLRTSRGAPRAAHRVLRAGAGRTFPRVPALDRLSPASLPVRALCGGPGPDRPRARGGGRAPRLRRRRGRRYGGAWRDRDRRPPVRGARSARRREPVRALMSGICSGPAVPSARVRVAAHALGRRRSRLLWPYLSAAWRLTGDPRWQWLEGDAQLRRNLRSRRRRCRRSTLWRTAPRAASHQPPAASTNRCAAAPRPRAICSRGSSPRSGRCAGRSSTAVERACRAAAAAPIPAIRCSAPPRTPIRFAGSWSVRLRGGGHHANHVHPGRLAELGASTSRCPNAGGRRRTGRAGSRSASRPRSRPRSAADPADRAQARPAGPVPLDHVARHGAVRRRASG